MVKPLKEKLHGQSSHQSGETITFGKISIEFGEELWLSLSTY